MVVAPAAQQLANTSQVGGSTVPAAVVAGSAVAGGAVALLLVIGLATIACRRRPRVTVAHRTVPLASPNVRTEYGSCAQPQCQYDDITDVRQYGSSSLATLS
jgi:hypothetical protein